MTNTLAPSLLATAATATPYSSWPEDGSLPPGYFPPKASPAAASFFKENGYVVVADAFPKAELKELTRETARICRNDAGLIGGISPAEKGLSDEEAMRRVLCIHFPHKLSELFHQSLSHPSIVDILTKVVGPNVKAMQSMLFVKASGKPGQAWHQDEDYIPTRDRSLIGAWIAFDDATIENGCLWVLPKSHQRGILWPQKIHFDNRFDCGHESFHFPFDENDSVPVEVKAGSVVFFNGYLLHRSLPNRSPGQFRRSLVNHYMSAESLLPWMKEDNVGMAVLDYRDIVMVAGEDPYAYKGIKTGQMAFVRTDGKSGCADWTDAERKKTDDLVAAVNGNGHHH